ncbi:MAG: acireductone synthase [Acidobacteriota bacterium]|nr:acireductone synthase [Acidobacteriota bacterium]
MTEAILLDIEGTTTPIDFVHRTLFPFAFEHIGEYLEKNFDAVQTEIAQLRAEHTRDSENGSGAPPLDETTRENAIKSLTGYLRFLIEIDRKSTPLKSLQGKIWQRGYESGELVSEVFDDVPRAFERWKNQGKTIAIYSSGSVLAQQLLFKYTNHGDLTAFISNYFDTHIGHKREAQSYRKIASTPSFPQVENFLFISDIEAELDAASEAGMRVLLVVREGNAPLAEEKPKYRLIYTFDEAA